MEKRRGFRFGGRTVMAGVVVVALVAAVAMAQPAGRQALRGRARGGMGMGPGLGVQGMVPLGRLNLTEQQRQQVKDVLAAHKPGLTALTERAAPARRALADAIATADEAAIRQASAILAAVQADRAVLAGKIRAEILALLTPEQREKAKEIRARVEERTAERRALRPRGRLF